MSKCTLIVDDRDSVRRLLRHYVEIGTGCRNYGEAVDGVDAIEKASLLKPDLILMDLTMPNMNGIEAASALKRMMPSVPIILFTMHDESLGRELISAACVDVVLSKPNGLRNLVACAQRFLQSAGNEGASR